MNDYRILLIRFSSIGDIILTAPVIKAIRQKFPKAVIDYLTLSEFSILLKDNPNLNNLVLFERGKNIFYYIRKALLLKKNNYDHVIDLHRSTRSFIFRFILKAKKKSKFKKNYFKRFLLIFLKFNLYKAPYSVIERYYNTAGIKNSDGSCGTEIWLSPNEITRAVSKLNNFSGASYTLKKNTAEKKVRIEHGIINSSQKIISIMPFAKWKTKEWGDEKFIELGRILAEKTGAQIQILGGPIDTSRAASIAESIGPAAVMLAGKLSIPESAAAISASGCLISNDTGVMHLGGAVNIPVIAIFGCTTEELGFFPVNRKCEVIQIPLKCRPCTAKGLSACPKKHFKCMNDIPIEMVFQAAIKYLN
jgi:lipopolysaccharide heptosyltransferase II